MMRLNRANSLWAIFAMALLVGGSTHPTATAQSSGTVSSSGPLIKIYFTDGGADIAGAGAGTVRSVNPDGTGLTTLVGAAGIRPRGIVLDDTNKHLYWNDFGNSASTGKTLRSNLDGTSVTTIADHGQAGVNDIDLDIAAGHVYMSLSVSFSPFHGVRRVNFDGTGLVNVITTWPGGSEAPAGIPTGWFIDGLTTDPVNGRLYYGDVGILVLNGGPSGIVRTALDGTGAASLVPHLHGRGRGLALEPDPFAPGGGRMYFAQHDPASIGSGRIWRANLDGTGLTAIVSGLERPRDVALDLVAGKVYWTDEFTLKIQRANLNGTSVEDVVTGLDGPSSLTLQAQPNREPDCSKAAPSVAVLWPPNHQFVPITITGVTDPDGDPVTITIDSIRQDETVKQKGGGAGNTSPDGMGVGTSTASVRAERNGEPKTPGNGRVYHIAFTADDGNGGTCSGTVKVCVPHDQSKPTCIDDGPLFDSTTP